MNKKVFLICSVTSIVTLQIVFYNLQKFIEFNNTECYNMS